MKYTELEDANLLVTRTELREAVVSIHEDMLEIKTAILKLRNSLWLNVAVPSLTLIVSLVIYYIFKH